MRMPDTLILLDVYFNPVGQWLIFRADEERPAPGYWGGIETAAADQALRLSADLPPGPHYWMTLPDMLTVIGKLGSRPATESYALRRTGYGGPVMIGRDIDAAALASVLDCTPEQIVEHYRLLVRVAELDDPPPPADTAEPPVPPGAAAGQAGTVPAAAAPDGSPA